MIVEDEHLLRQGVQEMLEMNGYTVVGAGDGVEALEWLGEAQIDLIITDLVMPNMDGVDFVQRLRATHPETPVIVISGSSTAVRARYGLTSIDIPGANISMAKPFKIAQLLANVQALLAEA